MAGAYPLPFLWRENDHTRIVQHQAQAGPDMGPACERDRVFGKASIQLPFWTTENYQSSANHIGDAQGKEEIKKARRNMPPGLPKTLDGITQQRRYPWRLYAHFYRLSTSTAAPPASSRTTGSRTPALTSIAPGGTTAIPMAASSA